MKNKMSHLEQEIYFNLREGNIYDIDFIGRLVDIKRKTLLVLLSRMQKDGWLTRLKRGRYLVNPPGGAQLNDPFVVALNTFNGYIGLSSALYVYNALDEQPSTIYICTVNKSATKTMGNLKIEAIAFGKRATGMTFFKNYFVSSKPKTIYDCFYMPEYSGGYSNILAAVSKLELNESDWKTFLFYVKKFGNASFSRKVGFLLEILKEKTGAAIPGWLLARLNIGGHVIKLGSGRGGKFIKKWNIVNYIGEGDLLGKTLWKR